MKRSNNLILSVLFLMVLLFFNDIGVAKGEESPRLVKSQTYGGFCKIEICKAACKSEGFEDGVCARRPRSHYKSSPCHCTNLVLVTNCIH
ncbi:hypothetical protein ACP275_11G101400 [Erythranthe tilingii]